MKSPRRLSSRNRGQMAQSMLLVAVLAVVTYSLIQILQYLNVFSQKKIAASRQSLINASAVETFLVAKTMAMRRYMEALLAGGPGCVSANSFLDALKNGAGIGCGVDVTVFNETDPNFDVGLLLDAKGQVYEYPGPGCRITETASSCSNGQNEVLIVNSENSFGHDMEAEKKRFHFYVATLKPENKLAEFLVSNEQMADNYTGPVEYITAGVAMAMAPHPRWKDFKWTFALKGEFPPNTVHLNPDGTVISQAVDPLAVCEGHGAWSKMLVYNPITRKCDTFAQLGGGTGIAYYKGRYFGFRPADGQVIDLAEFSMGTSYLVDEDGTIGGSGPEVFPPYNKALLINADDITVIGKQIYYVRGQGAEARIGAISPIGGWHRFDFCPPPGVFPLNPNKRLGDAGWSQSYDGLTALSSSVPLLFEKDDNLKIRPAIFFLKTSGGSLITSVIIGPEDGDVGDPDGRNFQCMHVKDRHIQEIENWRTLGFDRTAFSKPYMIY